MWHHYVNFVLSRFNGLRQFVSIFQGLNNSTRFRYHTFITDKIRVYADGIWRRRFNGIYTLEDSNHTCASQSTRYVPLRVNQSVFARK